MNNGSKAALVTGSIIIGLGLLLFRKEVKFFFERYITSTTAENKTKDNKPATIKSKGPSNASVGKVIDSYEGINVYYNGNVRDVHGRNTTADGYNLGLKFQCVEFVKRYYYTMFRHKMPDSYGDAKDFFDFKLNDGSYNAKRGLMQYTNPSLIKPKKHDILVYGPNQYNSFGHVAIVTEVGEQTLSCIGQNLGPGNGTRRDYRLSYESGQWQVDEEDILGWLRMR